MTELGVSLTLVNLTTLELSFMLLELAIMLLENIYSTGVTHDDRHSQLPHFIVQAIGVPKWRNLW
jgi:hypothetical protein